MNSMKKSSSSSSLCSLMKRKFPTTVRGRLLLLFALIFLVFSINAIIVGISLSHLENADLGIKVRRLNLAKLVDFEKNGLSVEFEFSAFNPVPINYDVSVSDVKLYHVNRVSGEAIPLCSLVTDINDLHFSKISAMSFKVNSTVLASIDNVKNLVLGSAPGEELDIKFEASVTLKTNAFWFPLSFSRDISKQVTTDHASIQVSRYIDAKVEEFVGEEKEDGGLIELDLAFSISYPQQASGIEVFWTLDSFSGNVLDSVGGLAASFYVPEHSVNETNKIVKAKVQFRQQNMDSIMNFISSFSRAEDISAQIQFNPSESVDWPKQLDLVRIGFSYNLIRSFFPALTTGNGLGASNRGLIYDIEWRNIFPHPGSEMGLVFTFDATLFISRFFSSSSYALSKVLRGHIDKLEVEGYVPDAVNSSDVTRALYMAVKTQNNSWIDLHNDPYKFSCEIIIYNISALSNIFLTSNNPSDVIYFTGAKSSNHFISSLLSIFKFKIPNFLAPNVGYEKLLAAQDAHQTALQEKSSLSLHPTSRQLSFNFQSEVITAGGARKLSEEVLQTLEDVSSFGRFSWRSIAFGVNLGNLRIPLEMNLRIPEGEAYCLRYDVANTGSGCMFKSSDFKFTLTLLWSHLNVSDSELMEGLKRLGSTGISLSDLIFEFEVDSIRRTLSPSIINAWSSLSGHSNMLPHSVQSHFADIRKSIEVKALGGSSNYAKHAGELIKFVKGYLRSFLYPIESKRPQLLHQAISSLPEDSMAVLITPEFWKNIGEVIKLPEFSKKAVESVLSNSSKLVTKALEYELAVISKLILDSFKEESSRSLKTGNASIFQKRRNSASDRSFFYPFLQASLRYLGENLAGYEMTNLVDLGDLLSSSNINLSEMPKAAGPVFIDFFQGYFDKVGPVIKADMISSFLELDNTTSTEKALAKMIHHSGPFMQKTFQLFGENVKNERLKVLLKQMKSEIEPMTESELRAQIELGFGSVEAFLKQFPEFEWKSKNAASVGEGHIGKMEKDGKLLPVYIKFKRPNLEHKLQEETDFLLQIAIKHHQYRMFKIVAESFASELDLSNEVSKGVDASSYFGLDSGPVRVVKYLAPLGSETNIGLAMQVASGKTISSFMKERAMAKDIKAGCVLENFLIETLRQWFTTAVYVSEDKPGFFHGDPHGGNLMFQYNETSPRDSFVTMIDFGNSHPVTKDLAKAFLYVGTGIRLGIPSLVFYGLGNSDFFNGASGASASSSCECHGNGTFTCDSCLKNDWTELYHELSTLFADENYKNQPMELQFDDAVKLIGNYGRLPFPDKSVEFFRAKTHLEKLIRDVRNAFGDAELSSVGCPRPDLAVLYTGWGFQPESFNAMGGIPHMLSNIGMAGVGKFAVQETPRYVAAKMNQLFYPSSNRRNPEFMPREL